MLYRPDVCNCTMPYVPRTVPAYAVRDPAYTAEVVALSLVEIDVCRPGFHVPDISDSSRTVHKFVQVVLVPATS